MLHAAHQFTNRSYFLTWVKCAFFNLSLVASVSTAVKLDRWFAVCLCKDTFTKTSRTGLDRCGCSGCFISWPKVASRSQSPKARSSPSNSSSTAGFYNPASPRVLMLGNWRAWLLPEGIILPSERGSTQNHHEMSVQTLDSASLASKNTSLSKLQLVLLATKFTRANIQFPISD